MGRDLEKVETKIDGNEISSLEILTLDEVIGMIRNHKIIDSKTIIALAFAGGVECWSAGLLGNKSSKPKTNLFL